MRVACPHCGRQGGIPDGQKLPAVVRCPGCKQSFAPAPIQGQRPAVAAAPDPPTLPGPTHSPPPARVEPPVLHPTPARPPERACDYCGETILVTAKKCKHCGELLDPAMRAAEDNRRRSQAPAHAAPVVVQNTVVAVSSATVVQEGSGSQGGCCGCLALAVIALACVGIFGKGCQLAEPTRHSGTFVPAPASPNVETPKPPAPEDQAPEPAAEDAPAEPEPPKKTTGPDAPTLVRMGKGLEERNPSAAVKYYRAAVERFPDSPEAKEAADRIDAMKKAGPP